MSNNGGDDDTLPSSMPPPDDDLHRRLAFLEQRQREEVREHVHQRHALDWTREQLTLMRTSLGNVADAVSKLTDSVRALKNELADRDTRIHRELASLHRQDSIHDIDIELVKATVGQKIVTGAKQAASWKNAFLALAVSIVSFLASHLDDLWRMLFP